MPTGYQEIARTYRDIFRDKFLKVALPSGELDPAEPHWPFRRVDLECPDNPNVNRAIVVVDFNQLLGREVLAANTVDEYKGRFVGTIHLNRSLFLQSDGDHNMEVLTDRKCVLAHEWLEVMHAICNGGRDRPRAVRGRSEYLAILARLQKGLPMEDSKNHWIQLSSALREALVSGQTLLERLKDFSIFSVDEFQEKYLEAARNGTDRYWLGKVAGDISKKIFVEPQLIEERLEELLLDGESG